MEMVTETMINSILRGKFRCAGSCYKHGKGDIIPRSCVFSYSDSQVDSFTLLWK